MYEKVVLYVQAATALKAERRQHKYAIIHEDGTCHVRCQQSMTRKCRLRCRIELRRCRLERFRLLSRNLPRRRTAARRPFTMPIADLIVRYQGKETRPRQPAKRWPCADRSRARNRSVCPQFLSCAPGTLTTSACSKTGLTGILAGSPPMPSWRGSAIRGAVPDAVLADTPCSV